jgi:LysR family transcriptional regulator, hydrogen peroxide-inducible genes activator
MEMHEIRYFLAVSETLNFTRAAEHCNVSQPSLTRAIKNLEEKLGSGPLVHRERGNTHLTELGHMMLPYFQGMLTNLQAAQDKARSYQTPSGAALTIGLMCTIGPKLLLDLFSEFQEAHPGLQINLVDGPVPLIEEQLAKGALDVAIYGKPETLDDRFFALPLFRERFMVALPPRHPLANQNGIRMRDLDQQRYLGRANCEFLDRLRQIRLEIGGVEFVRPYTSDRDDWVQTMVMAGLGFTYMPEYAVTLPGLTVLPLVEPEVWRTVQLVTVRGRPHSPAIGAFLRQVRRCKWAGKVDPPIGGAEVTDA